MIARLNKGFINNQPANWLADIVTKIARNNHLIDCEDSLIPIIEKAIDEHSGTTEKEIVLNAHLYEITSLQRKHLSIIDVDGSLSPLQYIYLFSSPSLLLMENGLYEWPVYKYMIEAYKRDRKYGSLFKQLGKAQSDNLIKSYHGGGNGQLIDLVQMKESENDYKGITHHKIFIVTDSDRESEIAPYPNRQTKDYRFFCDKEGNVDRTFIDTINQPHYHWHMWRKRAIENYLLPEKYKFERLDVENYKNIPLPQRNFVKVSDIIKKYKKGNIGNIARHMSREDYEGVSDKIYIDAEEISEIRLFLLKMVKVI